MAVMGWDEWAKHDATALAALVRKGELTPKCPSGRIMSHLNLLFVARKIGLPGANHL